MLVRLISLFSLFSLVFVTPATALCRGENQFDLLPEPTRAALIETARADPYGQGIFWKAEKDNTTVYVVGTLHIPHPALTPLAAALAPWISESDLALFEMTGPEEQEFQTRLAGDLSRLLMPGPPTLSERLGPEAWARLKDRIAPFKLAPEVANHLQPWLLALTIAIPPCAMAEAANGAKGLDFLLRDAVADQGVPAAPLDDVDSLIEALSGDPIDTQVDAFRVGLLNNDFSAASITTMTALYLDQELRLLWDQALATALDAATTDTEVETIMASYDNMLDQLIVARNHAWLDKILALAPGKTVFVAVGALHLPMEQGLLALLEDAGYNLTRQALPIALEP